jgi:hypothetical protein
MVKRLLKNLSRPHLSVPWFLKKPGFIGFASGRLNGGQRVLRGVFRTRCG